MLCGVSIGSGDWLNPCHTHLIPVLIPSDQNSWEAGDTHPTGILSRLKRCYCTVLIELNGAE